MLAHAESKEVKAKSERSRLVIVKPPAVIGPYSVEEASLKTLKSVDMSLSSPEEAIAAFQDALKLNPNNAEAHLSLGKTEMNSGRLDAAITDLNEALRLNPDNNQARRLLSQVYARSGDKEHAVAFAATSANAPEKVEADLLGDFFVPQWQMPPEIKNP